MQAVSEDASAESEAGATPNSDAPKTDAEKKAVWCFAALQSAEGKCHDTGMEFGKAVIELHDEIKASGDRDFMARLKQLGITYEKARYWMAKIEGKPTDRHKSASQEKPFDWKAAEAWLEALRDKVRILRQSEPIGGNILVAPLASLAELLGCQIVTKGGENV